MTRKGTSFSAGIKEELAGRIPAARHCQIASLAAILAAEGFAVHGAGKEAALYLTKDNPAISKKCFTILKKAFNMDTGFYEDAPPVHADGRSFYPVALEQTEVKTILQAVRALDADDTFSSFCRRGVFSMITRNTCCKRVFLRDTFLCGGSMSDPEKAYHLEFVCASGGIAETIRGLLADFGIKSGVTERGRYRVVYVKDGGDIVHLLNVMEAHVGLMELENLRIVKEMRGSLNRRVNCETANIGKTVSAAARQTEDIRYLEKHYGLDRLPEPLREAARVRLESPFATIAELAEQMTPPLKKSGMNHRLQKLTLLAKTLREETAEDEEPTGEG